ncbi:PRC-barrel domain containing protein [Kitasatospora sp. NPDC094015]|uniref:PRC-barrel domain containing protein n=1 Tax=Kitasatospora sp. NPDC094015 TaxID=3155205 RepID=UPI003317770B
MTPEAAQQQQPDVLGYRVEATDGHVGKVDRHSVYVDERHIVVDTGVWVFGKEISVPVSAVLRVDESARTLWLDLSKAELKKAYHDQMARYFGTDH